MKLVFPKLDLSNLSFPMCRFIFRISDVWKSYDSFLHSNIDIASQHTTYFSFCCILWDFPKEGPFVLVILISKNVFLTEKDIQIVRFHFLFTENKVVRGKAF